MKEKIRNYIVLGGQYSIEKLMLIIFGINFFEKIYLVGELGLIFSLYYHRIKHKLLTEEIQSLLKKVFKYIDNAENLIL